MERYRTFLIGDDGRIAGFKKLSRPQRWPKRLGKPAKLTAVETLKFGPVRGSSQRSRKENRAAGRRIAGRHNRK
jgi:hypothetical protein